MSKYTHIFFDFDETIFNHRSYISWLTNYFGKNDNTNLFLNSFNDYHEPKGENLRLYHHREHLKDTLGEEWPFFSAETEKESRKLKKDFCYRDSHRALSEVCKNAKDVRILTYGLSEYQYYKIRTCKLITELNIPVHVVLEPKANFLKKYFNETNVRGVLIDDKSPLHLPKNWDHIWINRVGVKAKDKNAREISNLRQIKSYIL